MSVEGAVDLNITSVLQVIDLLQIENKQEVLNQVMDTWRYLYQQAKKEKEKLQEAEKKNIKK